MDNRIIKYFLIGLIAFIAIRYIPSNALDDLEILVEEHMVDRRNDEDIERDAYNMEDMNDDYNDGNYEGFELDADDYNNYN